MHRPPHRWAIIRSWTDPDAITTGNNRGAGAGAGAGACAGEDVGVHRHPNIFAALGLAARAGPDARLTVTGANNGAGAREDAEVHGHAHAVSDATWDATWDAPHRDAPHRDAHPLLVTNGSITSPSATSKCKKKDSPSKLKLKLKLLKRTDLQPDARAHAGSGGDHDHDQDDDGPEFPCPICFENAEDADVHDYPSRMCKLITLLDTIAN